MLASRPLEAGVPGGTGTWTLLAGPLPALPEGARVLGAADPAAPLQRMILVLKAGTEADRRLERFLEELQDPASSQYHRWLTPEASGARFGAARERLGCWSAGGTDAGWASPSSAAPTSPTGTRRCSVGCTTCPPIPTPWW